MPISLYNPVSVKALKYIGPADPITGKIIYPTGGFTNDYQWNVRVDRNFGEKWRLSGTFLRDAYGDTPVEADPNYVRQTVTGETHKRPAMTGGINFTGNLRSP